MFYMKHRPAIEGFGNRLATLRKQRGFTQQELGKKVGVSYRVIAYYEIESQHPPAHLLVPLARALQVSVDELLGIKSIKQELDPRQAALWRKLKKAEQLSKKDRKALVDYIDALVARNTLRQVG